MLKHTAWLIVGKKEKKRKKTTQLHKQGRIHGSISRGRWAGAENLKKGLCYQRTDVQTDRRTEEWLIESRVRD